MRRLMISYLIGGFSCISGQTLVCTSCPANRRGEEVVKQFFSECDSFSSRGGASAANKSKRKHRNKDVIASAWYLPKAVERTIRPCSTRVISDSRSCRWAASAATCVGFLLWRFRFCERGGRGNLLLLLLRLVWLVFEWRIFPRLTSRTKFERRTLSLRSFCPTRFLLLPPPPSPLPSQRLIVTRGST
jgi:hypothetical protein